MASCFINDLVGVNQRLMSPSLGDLAEWLCNAFANLVRWLCKAAWQISRMAMQSFLAGIPCAPPLLGGAQGRKTKNQVGNKLPPFSDVPE